MKLALFLLLSGFLALTSAPVRSATVRELSTTELRKVAKGGEVISLKRVIDAVAKATGGEPIEARAFEMDGIFYRIVLKKADGTLVSVIIDAQTGEQVAKGSAVAKGVAAAAKASGTDKAVKDKAARGKSQTAGSNGNGNSGGNGGGNSGGNSGGNGGGNGNSGGNGGGSGGGNGGGKGKS